MLVGVVAVLVVLGAAALAEHQHIDGWAHDGRTTTARWFHEAKSALGFTSKPVSHVRHTTHPRHSVKHGGVTETTGPTGLTASINVAATSFRVKVVAVNGACWVAATTGGDPTPVFEQVITAGQSHIFTVAKSMTIETGSAAGHAYIYSGAKQIGTYFPTKAPFTMTFNAVG
jgi:hypothetical protein